MYVGVDFSPVDGGEIISEAFDFVNDLATGDSITSVVWTCSVATGSTAIDPSPASRMFGSPQFSGTIVSQRFTGFVAGVTYLLLAQVTTTFGDKLDLWSHVFIETPN